MSPPWTSHAHAHAHAPGHEHEGPTSHEHSCLRHEQKAIEPPKVKEPKSRERQEKNHGYEPAETTVSHVLSGIHTYFQEYERRL